MATRTFTQPSYQLETDLVRLYARATIGSAGVTSLVEGSGIASIAKTATGLYSLTLEDTYNRVMHVAAQMHASADNVAKTCLSGVSQVDTVTFSDKATAVAGDFFVVTDTAGQLWAASIDTTGTDPVPSSAIYTAIPAGRKVHVDISGATTAANVCTAVNTPFAALTGIGTTTTVGSPSTDHFAITQVLRAPVARVAVYKKDGTASPLTIAVTAGAAGVQTAINPATAHESLTIAAHGFETGRSVALAIGGGSLPTGWSATTYFIVKISANEFAFATTLANAEAGTVVAISDYGTAAQTLTVTPNAPAGSAVAKIEFTSPSLLTDTQTVTALTFACYDYAGAIVQPNNGSILMIELVVRNSNLKSKNEV